MTDKIKVSDTLRIFVLLHSANVCYCLYSQCSASETLTKETTLSEIKLDTFVTHLKLKLINISMIEIIDLRPR